ncbi:MAG: hypothetical protein MUC49_11290 [Raineya sp.]|jgi:Leucine-rich repeat (LRR) protein|nr:hypothetical protein [Raineya sp.]
MQNPKFENLLLLLEHENTFELGLELAQNYQSEFESYFGCNVYEYKELVEFLAKDYLWSFGTPLSKVSKLDFNYVELEKFPTNMFLLSNLQNLNLSNTYTAELPMEIGHLKNLTDLDLSNNYLRELPKEIARLENLVYLNLNHNRFNELSMEITQLENLQTLVLSRNRFTKLPQELKNLDCKIYLDISASKALRESVRGWKNVVFEDYIKYD